MLPVHVNILFAITFLKVSITYHMPVANVTAVVLPARIFFCDKHRDD